MPSIFEQVFRWVSNAFVLPGSEIKNQDSLSCRLPVVSIDHFRYELISQLRRAAEQGATKILITSDELCQSIRMGKASTDACCEAMQAEMKPGDVLLVEQSSGAGMTVRYLLPRPGP
jgi:hypothetical protein